MSEKTKTIFKTLGWIAMFLAAVASVWVAVRKANIQVTIHSVSNLAKDLSDSSNIAFKIGGREIDVNKNNLFQIVVRVNSSGKSIKDSDFPPRWGLKISGEVLRVTFTNSEPDLIQILEANSSTEGSNVYFPNFNFNEGDGFTATILTVQPKSEEPLVEGTGRIHDGRIVVERDSGEKGFLERVVDGNLLVHIFRAVIYFFIFLLLVLPFVAATSGSSDAKSARKWVSKIISKAKVGKSREEKELLSRIYDAISADIGGAAGGSTMPLRCLKTIVKIGEGTFEADSGESIRGGYVNHRFDHSWATESVDGGMRRFKPKVVKLCKEILETAGSETWLGQTKRE